MVRQQRQQQCLAIMAKLAANSKNRNIMGKIQENVM